MLQRKALTWFIILSFGISWPLFFVPLLFQELEPARLQLVTTGFWALAMWGPGLAAIATTLAVVKQPFKTLRLNTLGQKRYYIWAWFLPLLLTILTGLLTILIGSGQLDTDYTFLQAQLEQSGTQLPIPLGTLVIIQFAQALILGPLINLIFAMGEEIGWRGFLLPLLMPLGQWKALLISGAIWGLWHAPAIAQGLNYPEHPILGILLMTIFCILLGIIFGWLYLNTRSPWVAGIAHGSLNASAGLPLFFLLPGYDSALGGTIASLTGWVVMGLFIGWLLLTKRLPVRVEEEAETVTTHSP
jgi:membrane protease YdiL (CAAX protease family)